MYVGEFANLIGVALFVIQCGQFTKRREDRRAAIASLAVSVPIRTLFACFCNAFITYPLCSGHGTPSEPGDYHGSRGQSGHQRSDTFIFLATIPFNLIKLGLNCFVGYLLYTRLLAVYPAVRTA